MQKVLWRCSREVGVIECICFYLRLRVEVVDKLPCSALQRYVEMWLVSSSASSFDLHDKEIILVRNCTITSFPLRYMH